MVGNGSKKQINEVGTGYAFEVVDQASSGSTLDQYFYPPPSLPAQNQPKAEKKPDTFILNFAKGSSPTVNILQK
ncbi:hypothetical protein B9Z55_016373 [Caenorhabditis nigoni]|uniref:Uncharacterized protein n=1 Tax=Caenorhabditis nigoni TaxID=1611254 RepID=A0A2G5T4S2_9PELO|nr:hypothetical protein B9Z55_016373 [Caenorhabditis nigoni]